MTTEDRAGQIVRRLPSACDDPTGHPAYADVLAALRAERAAALKDAAGIADAEPEPQGEPPAAWLEMTRLDPALSCLATVCVTRGNIAAAICALAAALSIARRVLEDENAG